MSQSSTISKGKPKRKESNEQQQQILKTNELPQGTEEEGDSDRKQITEARTVLSGIHRQPRQNSFGALEASLPSLDDDDDDDESPGLMQFFASRTKKQHATLSTAKTRSDVSAITLDTALDPTATEEVPVLKDMTTVFSPLPMPSTDINNTDAIRMRRASLSAAIPTLPEQQNRQQRRASVAGGEPYLDSSLSNARQPRRLMEYPPSPRENNHKTQPLIMPQRRSSSPRPILTNDSPQKSPTLLPFVGSPRRKPDPQARTPTDRDTLATYLLDQRKLEPTGRTNTGGCSTRFPESRQDESPVSPASSKRSFSSSNRPTSPSLKQSQSSLEKLGSSHDDDNAQKRSRRPKSALDNNVGNKPLSSSLPIEKRVPSPPRRVDHNNNATSSTLEKEVSGSVVMNKSMIMKKQASARKVRPIGQDADISSSSPEKPLMLQSAPKAQNNSVPPTSPRRIRVDSRNTGSLSRPKADNGKDVSPCRSVSKKIPGENNVRNSSSPVRSPRKSHNKSTQTPVSSKTTADFATTSPSGVKKRIKSPEGKRKGRSASLSHLTALTIPGLPAGQASSRIIKESPVLETTAQQPPMDSKSESLLSKSSVVRNLDPLEQLPELPISERNNSDGPVTPCNQSPHRSSRTGAVMSTDPSRIIKHNRTSPLRRKQRASSMGHVPIVKKGTFVVNEQQSEPASNIGSPRIKGPKANKSEDKTASLPNKSPPSPRRRRRRVASMQLVSAKILNGDDVKSSELDKIKKSASRGKRAMSMQHVSIPVGLDTATAKQSSTLTLLKSDIQQASEQRLSDRSNRRLRRCTSSDFMPHTGYDSAPESEIIPLDGDFMQQKSTPRYARSRSTGFNSDLVINDLASFARAESQSGRTKAGSSKSNDLFGIATAFFRKVEKKSALTRLDESSVSYAKAGSLLQERYRSVPS